ncbi:hypothetical protein CHN49_24575 [Pseudomonas putida]|nr:hypothetical protein CHN49_24575 [Pseudomonas putida]
MPAKGHALPANLHPPFTVAATTVFAGKPAPTVAAYRQSDGFCNTPCQQRPAQQQRTDNCQRP